VSEERDPVRWLDEGSEAPEELRRVLGAGRDALGTSDELGRLQASLARALGPSAGLMDDSPVSGTGRVAGDAATGVAAQGSTSSLELWLVGAVIASGVAGAVLFDVAPWNREPVARSAVPVTSSVRAPSDIVAAPAAPSEPAPSVVPAPSEPLQEAAPVAAEPARPSRARPAPRAESEAALLQRAQAALAGDPARALALTREHQRRFPRGSLSQEREVIAIEALKRVGAGRAAGEKASEFEQRYRGSVHEGRVRESVSAEPAVPAPEK
jgi:hypothetical protein